jgi:hypothetical protein
MLRATGIVFDEEDWKVIIQSAAVLRHVTGALRELQSQSMYIGEHAPLLLELRELLEKPQTILTHPADFKLTASQLNELSMTGHKHASCLESLWDERLASKPLTPGITHPYVTQLIDSLLVAFLKRCASTTSQFTCLPTLWAMMLDPLQKVAFKRNQLAKIATWTVALAALRVKLTEARTRLCCLLRASKYACTRATVVQRRQHTCCVSKRRVCAACVRQGVPTRTCAAQRPNGN